MNTFFAFLRELISTIFAKPAYSTDPIPQSSEPTNPPAPPSSPSEPPKYSWDTPEDARHSVRLICDEEGLTVKQKNDLSSTIHCESNYDPNCIHPNIVSGRTTSTDWGICQINDYFHIGPGKDFPDTDYVLKNPEACVRWMCRQWKAGNGRLWVCFGKGLYHSYAA